MVVSKSNFTWTGTRFLKIPKHWTSLAKRKLCGPENQSIRRLLGENTIHVVHNREERV